MPFFVALPDNESLFQDQIIFQNEAFPILPLLTLLKGEYDEHQGSTENSHFHNEKLLLTIKCSA